MSDAGQDSRKPPLLVTAELPSDVLAWADALRREHYPPERNRLRAHVTLFHALPPSVEDELVELLSGLAKESPPDARITGLMKLADGTALAIESPRMTELHGIIADRLHGLLVKQDHRPLRLHITIQNKVDSVAARKLQSELAPVLERRNFRFSGLGIYAWRDGLWNHKRTISFRGQ